jgi:hypothetical protein
VLDDVVADARRGGGRERHRGHGWELGAEGGELAVFGAEVVAPFGDAVRLVDGEKLHGPLLQAVDEAVEREAFGGDVEQAVLARVEAAVTALRLLGAEGRVHEGGRDAGGAELVDLILHQRDQRRDDDGQAGRGAGESGELETERLPAPVGSTGERVAVGEGRGDDVALQRPEPVVAEDLLEQVGEFIGGGRLGGGFGHGAARGTLPGQRRKRNAGAVRKATNLGV